MHGGRELNKLRKGFCVEVKIAQELLVPLTTKHSDSKDKSPIFLVDQPYLVYTENCQIEQFLNNMKVFISTAAVFFNKINGLLLVIIQNLGA